MTLTRHDLRAVSFLLLAIGVYAAAASLSARLPSLDGGAVVSLGLTLDLVLVVPALFFVLVARPRDWPVTTVAPVVAVGLLASRLAVPAEHRESLQLLNALPIVLELALVTWIALKVRAYLRRSPEISGPVDVRDRLVRVAESVLGRHRAAEILAYEMSVFYYALLAWRSPLPESGAECFTGYRKSGYSQVFAGLVMVMVCELVVAHVVVQAVWNGVAAWVLTGLGIYGMVWFLGDWQALRRRPIELTPDALELRVGLRWDLTIPYGRLRAVRRVEKRTSAGSGLDVSLFGSPTFELELAESVRASGVYGWCKEVEVVCFQVDEPDVFEARLRESFEAGSPAAHAIHPTWECVVESR